MAKLGNYIRLVDKRNSNLQVTKLYGVSNNKEFIPSIANTIGTDLSSYKIVSYNQFAFGAVTSRNGDKISIALLKDEECIISSTYIVFEIIDDGILNPDYLMMWFRRKEFDRYARYMSHGSVRELFTWEKLCDVEIPLPSIEVQIKIVKQYSLLTEKLRMIDKKNEKLSKLFMLNFNKFYSDLNLINAKEGTLGDILVLRGESLPKKNIKKDDIYLPIEFIDKNSLSLRKYGSSKDAESSLVKFYENDILIGAMRVYFHRVVVAPFDGITRTTCFVLNPIKPDYLSFALGLCNLDSTIDYAQASSKGTTMPYAVWTGKLEKMSILIPEISKIEKFNKDNLYILDAIKKSVYLYSKLNKLKDMYIDYIAFN